MVAQTDHLVSIKLETHGSPNECEPQGTPVLREHTTSSGDSLPILEGFAEEQIRILIRRVFFPGWPRGSRQVVISGMDTATDSAGLCVRLAREMARGLPGTVAAIEADARSPRMAALLKNSLQDPSAQYRIGPVPISRNLSLVAADAVFDDQKGCSAVSLRARLSELRRQFDYTIIHAPAACMSDTLIIAGLADGIVLVVDAGKTRRLAALHNLQLLRTANVAVLGTVLIHRSFSLPAQLYRRL